MRQTHMLCMLPDWAWGGEARLSHFFQSLHCIHLKVSKKVYREQEPLMDPNIRCCVCERRW